MLNKIKVNAMLYCKIIKQDSLLKCALVYNSYVHN